MSESTNLEDELDRLLVDDLVESAAESEAEQDVIEDVTLANTIESGQETISIVDDELDDISEKLNIDDSTVQTAKSLFSQYHNKKELTGNALEVIAAACLYAACKVTSVPLMPEEFAEAGTAILTEKLLLRRTKTIASSLGLDAEAFFDPTQYVTRYCNELKLSEDLEHKAQKIVSSASEEGIASGKSPSGWAAAAIYNANLESGKPTTQSEIAEVAGITTVTIRNNYQEQREKLDIGDRRYKQIGENEKIPTQKERSDQSETTDYDSQSQLYQWGNNN